MQHIQEHQGRGSREETPVLLLDILDQVFPGQMDEVQAAKNRFDTVRAAQLQAQRQGDVKQALLLLNDVNTARIVNGLASSRGGAVYVHRAAIRGGLLDARGYGLLGSCKAVLLAPNGAIPTFGSRKTTRRRGSSEGGG